MWLVIHVLAKKQGVAPISPAFPFLLGFNVFSMSILSMPQKVSAEGCVSEWRAGRYVTVCLPMFLPLFN